MDLGNPIDIVVHHFLIEGIACLGRWDEFLVVSVLVYVMHTGHDLQWIMTQDYQLSWFTKLLYYIDSQPWEDIEFMSKSIGGIDPWVRP